MIGAAITLVGRSDAECHREHDGGGHDVTDFFELIKPGQASLPQKDVIRAITC